MLKNRTGENLEKNLIVTNESIVPLCNLFILLSRTVQEQAKLLAKSAQAKFEQALLTSFTRNVLILHVCIRKSSVDCYDVGQTVEVQEPTLLMLGELQLHSAGSSQRASEADRQPVLCGPCVLEEKENYGRFSCISQCKASLPCLMMIMS